MKQHKNLTNIFFLLNKCVKYNTGSTYLNTKRGHKKKQYQGQKKKKIIYKKGNSQTKEIVEFWYSTLSLKQESIGHMCGAAFPGGPLTTRQPAEY